MSSRNNSKVKIIWSGLILRIFIIFLLTIVIYLGFLFININKNIAKITTSKNTNIHHNNSLKKIAASVVNNDTRLKGESNDRINILLLGISGEKHSKSKYLTDTIMLVSINPVTYQLAILSIPRDLYVKIPNSTYHTKINALYTYGIRNKKMSRNESLDLIKKSIEEITSETINYYAILDFTGFKEAINILGGVNVQVKDDIIDNHYPGPNYSYQSFKISKGFHHLDAETALKYARVRHTKGGDFGRAQRQQQLIASAKKKALSLKILANPIKTLRLLDTLGNHLKTDISAEEIPRLISIVKDINIQQATTKVLDAWDKDSLLKSTRLPLGGVSAYVLIPKVKNYSQVKKLSKNIFDLNELEKFKAQISEEDANIKLLTAKHNSFDLFKKTLNQWGYTTGNYNPISYKSICKKGKDEIISYNKKENIFTLNDLTERLSLKVTYHSIVQSKKKSHPIDIVICITADTAEYFNIKEKNATMISKEIIYPEILDKNGKVLFNNSP